MLPGAALGGGGGDATDPRSTNGGLCQHLYGPQHLGRGPRHWHTPDRELCFSLGLQLAALGQHGLGLCGQAPFQPMNAEENLRPDILSVPTDNACLNSIKTK